MLTVPNTENQTLLSIYGASNSRPSKKVCVQKVLTAFNPTHSSDIVLFRGSEELKPAPERLKWLNKFFPETDLVVSYLKLSDRLQKEVEGWSKQVTAEDVQSFEKKHQIGLLEECADMLYEFQILQSIRRGIVHKDDLEVMADLVKGYLDNQKTFNATLEALRKLVKPKQIKAFQKMMGFENPELARNMLALTFCKFAMCKIRGNMVDAYAETRPRLMKETLELIERMPGRYIANRALRLHASLFTALPQLPASWFRWLPQRIVQSRMGSSAPAYEDYMGFLYQKHLSRNELDYNNCPGLNYEERKKILKPFELLLEFSFLKRLNPPTQKT